MTEHWKAAYPQMVVGGTEVLSQHKNYEIKKNEYTLAIYLKYEIAFFNDNFIRGNSTASHLLWSDFRMEVSHEVVIQPIS